MILGPRAGMLLAVFAALLVFTPTIFGDEGMWLFTNPPKKYLKDKHGFDVTDKWLDHVQKSSVRFNSGGSGSFVSADGLVITNHHVGADSLQKLGTKDKNYLRDGFHARTRAEEYKCEAMELNVLMKIEDVTERVNGAVKGVPPEKAAVARRAVINDIEKEASDKTKLKPQVVTLYQGAIYHLYLFKKYTDVRLVFAPEQQIAFFGGDPDNFEYPRFDLDICLFRVYEDGKPAKIDNYLKWSKDGSKEGELVFVPGHPGRTDRMNTIAELEYLRDIGYPYVLQRLNRMEVMLLSFSGRSEENARQARELLFSVQNSRKARIGGLAGLLDPETMARKKVEEEKLKRAWAEREGKSGPSPWERIAAAEKIRKENYRRATLLEQGAGFNSDLFSIARTLVRAAEERSKPNSERLQGFGDANLDSLKQQLFDPEPIYEDFEIVKLADSLTFLCGQLGVEDPLVQKVLAGKSPQARAAELITGSKLKDVELRKQLFDGGKEAINASTDPMIKLALLVDPESRAIRKLLETQVDEPKKQAYNEIAKVKFALEGTNTYPDATFTLRLAFGLVKGYEENGRKIPAFTTFAGLFERSAENMNKEPFDLPPRWIERKKHLNLETPLNFVSTADIIGGNSGSPVINRDAEFVGIIFDGNIQSLVLDFAFEEVQARAVSVDSRGIIEALRKVYQANDLADELQGSK